MLTIANYQLDIVRNGGLAPLAKLITSNKLPLILSAVACIRNISIHPLNESPIIDSGFLPHLVKLLDRSEDEVLTHTVITMRNVIPCTVRSNNSWRLRQTETKEHYSRRMQRQNASKYLIAKENRMLLEVRLLHSLLCSL